MVDIYRLIFFYFLYVCFIGYIRHNRHNCSGLWWFNTASFNNDKNRVTIMINHAFSVKTTLYNLWSRLYPHKNALVHFLTGLSFIQTWFCLAWYSCTIALWVILDTQKLTKIILPEQQLEHLATIYLLCLSNNLSYVC